MNELVSRRTRSAVRDLVNVVTIGRIHTMWQDAGYVQPSTFPEGIGGERVTLFQAYLDQVDWSSTDQFTRVRIVFEDAIEQRIKECGWDDRVDRVRKLLRYDGYTLDDDGTIAGAPTDAAAPVITSELLAGLTDPAVIHDHLDRIAAAIDRGDPAQAIGSAKELVESTAKLVLRQLNVPFTEKDDLPALVQRVQEALAIRPADVDGSADTSFGIKKILGGATGITHGLSEFRNRGWGTGHGPGQPRQGLGPRHARLAVNAARLWCEFVLDTLTDPRAPWRKKAAAPSTAGGQALHGPDMNLAAPAAGGHA
ncbi:abortive infection family protein [Kribbella sp. NPDC023972]|uniref:abortive infection family protein n=1 Tax=Kribbella sp. NPDC023972 TaxID=3154795 RepID=UPI0033DACF01